jgi:ABC-2 type transport system permease protein
MSTTTATKAPLSGVALLRSQIKYEQLAFWRIPMAAFITVGFSTIFMVLISAGAGNQSASEIGGQHTIQYLVPGFMAYGIMSACFIILANSLVVRRETGQLKRLRLSPIPSPVFMGGIFANSLIIGAIQVVILLTIGRLGFGVVLPHNWVALLLALIVGDICFTSLGVAMSTLIPNEDVGGPVVSIVFFLLMFISGLWYPLDPNSWLARVSAYFPTRRLITAVYAPFNHVPGATPWAWADLGVMLIWTAIGIFVARRLFSWAPKRS